MPTVGKGLLRALNVIIRLLRSVLSMSIRPPGAPSQRIDRTLDVSRSSHCKTASLERRLLRATTFLWRHCGSAAGPAFHKWPTCRYALLWDGWR
eukprot:236747-Prymnesium_polylepis.2